MRENLFSGDCVYCGRRVPKFGGKHWYGESGSCVAHNGCLTGDEVEAERPPPKPRKKRRMPGPGGTMFRDYGGNSKGAQVPTKGNVEMYSCSRCDHTQREPKAARRRRGSVRCPECSAVMQPKTAHRTKGRGKPKVCANKYCGAKMASASRRRYCTQCFNAFSDQQRYNVLEGKKPGGRLPKPDADA